MHTVVDEVLIALPIKSCYSEIEYAIRACEHAGVQSKYLADLDPSLADRGWKSRQLPADGYARGARRLRLVIKRLLDIVAVIVRCRIVLPLGMCIAAVIKLTSQGPVFFSHERYGYGKRRFRMYKFRTMVSDAEQQHSRLETLNEASGPVSRLRKIRA